MVTELPEREGEPLTDESVLSALQPLLDDLGISLPELQAVLVRQNGKSEGPRFPTLVADGTVPVKKDRQISSSPRGRALLICGILYPDAEWLDWALAELASVWGPPHRLARDFPFDLTDYYRDIGHDLKRAFVSFPGLKITDALPRWKHTTCTIEGLSGNSRRVNLDPGYVDGARVVLASTKDHSHRIYIGQGIFAEVTMRYGKGKWLYYPHTFPDFKTGRYDSFFSLVKNDWRRAIREEAKKS